MKRLFIALIILTLSSTILIAQTVKSSKALDLIFTDIRWNVDPKIRAIDGQIIYTIKKNKFSANEIQIDLNNQLHIDSLFLNENLVHYTHQNNKITIDINSGDEIIKIRIIYSGIPASSGFDSFVQDKHENIPIIWTLSEPYGASDWWPCFNNLNDKSDSLQIAITCPSEYKAIANGLLQNVFTKGNKKTFVWTHKHPIATYLIAFAVTNYAQKNIYYKHLASDSVLVENYVYPEDSATAITKIMNLEPAFRLFSQVYGAYPFANEKYGHAQFSWGGGMEHQTVSFVSNFEFFLLAHELSHQWFGDYITCGSFKDVWLNEGFATFSEALATEKLFGNKDFTNWKSNRNNRITSLPYGSLYVDDTTNIWRIFDSRLSYDKGGMVLQMLRTQIGDSAFFHGIRSYLVDSLLINNFAFTSDLKRHFEASSGKNLSNFFNEWIYGEGYPIYQTNYLIQDNSCYLFINQTTSSESVKFYHLKIPYLLKGENKDSLIWIEPSSNYKVFKINTNFIVDQVIFNPYFDIIGKWTVDKLDLSSKDFLLYPNPTTDTLHFVSKENIGHYDWKIYGINGKVYLNNEGEGEKEITINITNLKSGNYFLEIKTSSFTKTEKFIKN